MKLSKLLIGATMALSLSTPVFAEGMQVRIGAGQEGKGYDKRANEIKQRLNANKFTASVVNYAGSDEISNEVCEGNVEIGITQIDGVDIRESEGCKLAIIGFYGTEKGFILFPPNSDIDELDEIEPGQGVLVDVIGSGTDLFWRNLVRIETGEEGNKSPWHKAKPVNDIFLAADGLAASNEIAAVIMVTNTDSGDANELIEGGWTVGDLYDKDINDRLFRGDSLYANDAVDFKKFSFSGDDDGDAYVVRSVIVANPDWVNNLKANERSSYAKLLRVLTDVQKANLAN